MFRFRVGFETILISCDLRNARIIAEYTQFFLRTSRCYVQCNRFCTNLIWNLNAGSACCCQYKISPFQSLQVRCYLFARIQRETVLILFGGSFVEGISRIQKTITTLSFQKQRISVLGIRFDSNLIKPVFFGESIVFETFFISMCRIRCWSKIIITVYRI